MRGVLFLIPLLGALGCRADETEGAYTGLAGCWNTHEHSYTHAWSYAEGIEAYAFVYGARIYLHDDLLAVADMDRLACPDLDAEDGASGAATWVEDCASGAYFDTAGGTAVALVRGDADAARPDYLEWRFGVSDPGQAPFITGENDYDGDGRPDEDAAALDARDIKVQLAWIPASNGSGTTSADFLVDYWQYDTVCAAEAAADPDDDLDDWDCWSQWAYDATCGDPSAKSCWTALAEEQVGGAAAHWSDESPELTKSSEDCRDEG